MADLTHEIRAILMAAKTPEGVYFSHITTHIRLAVDNVETNEVAALIVTGEVPNLDDSTDTELAPVWLHRYTWGWMLGLDSGDQYALFN